jgi:hypothetical protein
LAVANGTAYPIDRFVMHTVPSRLIIGQYRPLEGEGESNAVIYIRNGRPFQSALTLDGQGFMRAARPRSVADFKNKAEVDAVNPDAVQRRRLRCA